MNQLALKAASQNVHDEAAAQAPLANDLKDRRSQELVFALVGPLGSGCTTVANELHKLLKNEYLYLAPKIITISDFIREGLKKKGKPLPSRETGLDNYIAAMQDAGNDLREEYGTTYLIEKAIEAIHTERKRAGGYSDGIIVPTRIAYIIDSIKNIDEAELLRGVYGDSLILIGVFAPDAIRNKRLKIKEGKKQTFVEILKRDQGEEASFGQKTRKVFTSSDFFICNDADLYRLNEKIERFVELVFDVGVHTPTREEAAMYKASSVAANSACMSRQVGAAIVSSAGEFIGVGWNDVPKFGGGLYNEDDRYSSTQDNRCYNWADGECHNEMRRMEIITDVVQKIVGAGLLKKGTGPEDVRNAIGGTRIKDLIEFSRSIHAEMEAIVSVAREGKHSLVGATLFTNTYPCHNCARHIVAAGIKRVVYIEPYLKSLATQLHEDAITEVPHDIDEDGNRVKDAAPQTKVFFQQFDGVAPKNFLKLFCPLAERKENGRRRIDDKTSVLPMLMIALDGPATYETKVVADLAIKEGSV
ncbi:anti-phage dCTP deaminase [Paracoccus salsus]|uniref:anti-phage dCTP deaminase n=1 Tax=Paracoccus salsus TaxID=2911061 RepID=UPI001F32465C|nr:anti-phage dCTP deaminase [Paracoccus salsus]MCF3975006.1 deaminase [Paracoccus salsus]